MKTSFHFYYYYYYLPHHAACRILVPWPGIEPTPLEEEVRVLTMGLPGKSRNLHFKQAPQMILMNLNPGKPTDLILLLFKNLSSLHPTLAPASSLFLHFFFFFFEPGSSTVLSPLPHSVHLLWHLPPTSIAQSIRHFSALLLLDVSNPSW